MFTSLRNLAVLTCLALAMAVHMPAQSTQVCNAGVCTNLVQISPNVFKVGIQASLTNTQLTTMFTTPVQLAGLSASTGFGVGSLATIDSCTLDLVFATGGFAGGGVVTIGYGTTAGVAAAATIAATALTTFSANQAITVAGALAINASTGILNKPLYITNATAVFTNASSGTSTAILSCSGTVTFGLS